MFMEAVVFSCAVLIICLGFICACVPIKAEQRPVSVHKIGGPRESKMCKCKGDGNSTGSQGRVFFSRDALTALDAKYKI